MCFIVPCNHTQIFLIFLIRKYWFVYNQNLEKIPPQIKLGVLIR